MAGTGLATVTLKVINDLASSPDRTWTVSVPPRSSVYTLLLQASANDPNFTFRAHYDDEWSSHLVTSINGVSASKGYRTYWSFEDQYNAPFDRGVDLIGVFNNDGIVFRFKQGPTKQGQPAHQGRPAKPI